MPDTLMHDIGIWLEFVLLELLLFTAIWFLIGAIDDFCVDLIWIMRGIYRRFRFYHRSKPMTANELPAPEKPGDLVIFVAVWQEAMVIGAMLRRCQREWGEHKKHTIYVGCYPNDEGSISAVLEAASNNPVIKLVLCGQPGPTTKADCLNRLWQAMTEDELRHGYKIKAVVLHDAEDMVDADELRIYDRLIEKNHVVQLPVIPVRVPGSRWISGHYCDEFAEAHGKSMVVREAMGVPLPLAGVGCAIERNMLGRIALASEHRPFDASSLTEDYELGLKIGQQGGRTILARLLNSNGDLIGTRACFPDTLEASVRQKTRWITGISLSGWDRLGWRKSWAENWMILRDRKAVFAAIVLAAAYLSILLMGLLTLMQFAGWHQWRQIPGPSLWLIGINALFLIWRLIMRASLVGAQHGLIEALCSVPRVIIANIIAVMAARRALTNYARYCISGRTLRWDKTAHVHFPDMPKGG